MKSYALPITSNARRKDETASRTAAVAFTSLLLSQAFKPLTQSLGFYGDVVLNACAENIACRERAGLTDRFERVFSAVVRSRA
jgi:hypothetical protein